jgi:hypothetical protein
MKLLLEKIHYEKYKWNICGDLKVIALLLGVQLGYTKYCCSLCEWDSRDSKILCNFHAHIELLAADLYIKITMNYKKKKKIKNSSEINLEYLLIK